MANGYNDMVFILEDDWGRMDWFHKQWDSIFDIRHADNYQRAIQIFNPKSTKALFLDHDLGGEIYVDSRLSNTGANFCRWLIKTELPRVTPIVVHSHNPDGANEMERTLRMGGFNWTYQMPFGVLMASWDRGTLEVLKHRKSRS
jgi:hypothetical protein